MLVYFDEDVSARLGVLRRLSPYGGCRSVEFRLDGAVHITLLVAHDLT